MNQTSMAGAGASSSWAQRAQVGATLPAYQNVSDWGWQAQQGYALETAAAVNEQKQINLATAIGMTAIVVGGVLLFLYARDTRQLGLLNEMDIGTIRYLAAYRAAGGS